MSRRNTGDLNLGKSNIKTFQNSLGFKELYNYIDKFDKSKNSVLISIILPVYNEENTIGSILQDLPHHPSIEIIVIDDHSTDASLQEIEKGRKDRGIRVLRHKSNRGYGATIMTGFKYATGQIIVTMDSDGQHNPDDLYYLIKPILDGKFDFTIGSRYLGTYHYKLPLSTRFGEVLTEKLLRLFFGVNILNNQNGFRGYKRDLIHIFDDMRYLGYAFCTEQILIATSLGYKIKECPIKVYDREYGSSKIVLWKLALDIFSSFFIYGFKNIKWIFTHKNEIKQSFYLTK
ncbi:MAG: glycosyltransferase family 2 protein [Candidatus Lokiarchaeota archaeon]|nr:glycosyltransferase family 2 protein [Candidatus Lokiarchaeota archaeon]